MNSRNRFFYFVVLHFNRSIIHNTDNYEPQYNENSTAYFKNASTPGVMPKAIKEDDFFAKSVPFPKCCPPGMFYRTESRSCTEVLVKNTSEIYEELNLSVNFIRSGLPKCAVIVDRFVSKFRSRIIPGRGDITVSRRKGKYGNRQFCVDKIVGDYKNYVVRLCEDKKYCTRDVGLDSKDLCLRKCCEDGHNVINGFCNPSDTTTGMKLKDEINFYKRAGNMAIMYGMNSYCRKNEKLDNFQISPYNNAIMFLKSDGKQYYLVTEYCIDTRYEDMVGNTTDYIYYCHSTVKLKALLAAFILSFLCYILTIGIYSFYYKLKKLVEKLIVCCCFVDMISDMIQILRMFELEFGNLCIYVGYFIIFVRTSRLSWRNVLSFEIYRVIGTTTGCLHQTKGFHRKLIMLYTIYAVGVPSVVLLNIFLCAEGIYPLPDIAVPTFANSSCVISIQAGKYGYLHSYIPMSVLSIVNIVLFGKTVYYFVKIKTNLEAPDSNINNKLMKSWIENGYIILKLGLIMGLTCIHTLFTNATYTKSQVFHSIASITRFIYILGGVYFFLIFGIKWKFVIAILYKFHILKKEDSKSTTLGDTVQSSEIVTESVSETCRL